MKNAKIHKLIDQDRPVSPNLAVIVLRKIVSRKHLAQYLSIDPHELLIRLRDNDGMGPPYLIIGKKRRLYYPIRPFVEWVEHRLIPNLKALREQAEMAATPVRKHPIKLERAA